MFGNYNMYGYPNNVQSMQSYQNSMQPCQNMQPNQTLIRVTGIDGARAYQMQANSVVPLFDSDNDIMYIKSTDGAGFPTIKAYTFAPYDFVQSPLTNNDYVTRAEFEELKGMIENGKQPVSNSAKKSNE
jgi:hypothetical protein